MFLVVYSDRGLVAGREPRLQLFNTLYWLTVSAFAACGCAYYITLVNETEYKEYLELLSVLGLDFLLMGYLENKKRTYVAGQCLNQTTLAAFGGKRRHNIFSGKDTRNYFYCMQIIFLLDLLTEKYPVGSFYHYLLHGTTVTYYTFIFAVYIPTKHYHSALQNFPELFREEKKITREGFYVRKPEKLIPRQPCNISDREQQEKEIVSSSRESLLQQDVYNVSIMGEDYSNATSAKSAPNNFLATVEVHCLQNENYEEYSKKRQLMGLPEVEI